MPDADSGTARYRDKPYKDGELLRRLYVDEKRSTMEIAEMLDCAPNTVRKYLKKEGVEIRELSDALKLAHGYSEYEVPFQTHVTGAEVWRHSYNNESNMVYVHRLLAVAKFGFDAVADNVVHHESEIRWDNRPGNLELMDHGDHTVHHKTKFDPETRKEIAERYEYTDDSSYTIAEDYSICAGTVRRMHEEHFGDNGGEKAT